MKLTKNEKRALVFLLEDGRISDTEIANRLRITKQAVGKIRKKFEQNGLIRRYAAELDYSMLGVSVFAIENIQLHNHGDLEKNKACLNSIKSESHIIKMCKAAEHDNFVVIYGFRSLDELEQFFAPPFVSSPHKNCIQHSDLRIFPPRCFLKNDGSDLCKKALLDL